VVLVSSSNGGFDHYSIIGGIEQIAEQQQPFRIEKFIEIDEYMVKMKKITVENLRTTSS
ncbi:hypothetical protein LOAG_15833, partial [Loa loa]